jgi:hypothetical protein
LGRLAKELELALSLAQAREQELARGLELE